MASGGSAGDRGTPELEQPAFIERHSPDRHSPSPECEYKRELPRDVELAEARASPHLSRKTLDELGQENENTEDPDNLPLHSTWTFWFDRSPRGSSAVDFFANLRPICTVKTIKVIGLYCTDNNTRKWKSREDLQSVITQMTLDRHEAFWRVVNNIQPVDNLGERESYHLMRNEKRRPVWEDMDNMDGGLWSFKVRKEDTVVVWQELLLAAIGEQFSDCMAEGDDVCGVSVRIRFDQNVIQIWNQESELHHKATVIQKVKELVPNVEINEYYQSNKSKMKDSLMKPHGPPPYQRGVSPTRYSGPPPLQRAPFYPPPGHPMYPPPRHPPPHVMHPRYRPPPPHQQPPYPPPRPHYPAP